MEVVYAVYIRVLDDDCFEPYLRFIGGGDKIYAVCSNKEDAILIRDEIKSIGTNGLRKLKIIKSNEEMTSCYISHPMAVDNTEAILRKLRSLK